MHFLEVIWISIGKFVFLFSNIFVHSEISMFNSEAYVLWFPLSRYRNMLAILCILYKIVKILDGFYIKTEWSFR